MGVWEYGRSFRDRGERVEDRPFSRPILQSSIFNPRPSDNLPYPHTPILPTIKKAGIVLLFLALAACGTPDTGGEQAATSRLEIDLDKSDPERLLRYYFGGYAGPDGGDPFVAGLLVEEEGGFFADVEALDARLSGIGVALREAAGDRRLEWEELEGFLHATYYDARSLPPTLEDFHAEVPYRDGDEAWFHVELDGVMSTARRHVYVAEGALRHALKTYRENGERLLYPEGAAIVGEHRVDGERIETTILRKRADGFWDFVTYGPNGALALKTQALPRALDTPTQCVGCHFGNKLFEPERSFPAPASPGPHGPRAFYVDDALRDGEVAAFFNEHRKRSDTVLGIYNTLFIAQLRADRRAGRLSDDDAQLLADLGL